MTTRSTRRGACLASIENVREDDSSAITKIPNVKRSMRSRKCGTTTYKTESESVPEPNLQEILHEKHDNVVSSPIASSKPPNERIRNTRSHKESKNVNTTITVDVDDKKAQNNKNIQHKVNTAETKLPIKISTRTTRRNKHKDDAEAILDVHVSEAILSNKENDSSSNDKMKKKKPKQEKKTAAASSKSPTLTNTANDLPKPSKRGSTDGSISNVAPRTRRGAKSNSNPPLEVRSPVMAKRRRNKKPDPKAARQKSSNSSKNVSSVSNETTFHSIDGGISKDASFSSVKDFDISESKHSSVINLSKSDLPSAKNYSQIFNESLPILVDDSITSGKGSSNKKNISPAIINISSKENSLLEPSQFMTRSKNSIRISGIEEFPLAKVSEKKPRRLEREGIYVKEFAAPDMNSTFNKTVDTSHNQSSFTRRHVFSAASPCKLYPRQGSLGNKKSIINCTFTKTPPKSLCRAISVGSAGRTPMPPLDKSLSADKLPEERTTPAKRSALNVTHSLEKPKKLKSPKPVEISKPKNKVEFCNSTKKPPCLPNAGKIIKSNLKGSGKSFVMSNTVARPGTRKRSLTQSDAETRGGKIRKLALKEPSTTSNRLIKLKTPVSVGKNLYSGRVNASLCSTTPAKPAEARQPPSASRKMPDFASLHKKQFAQMESLVQNKARKEERARQLLFSKTLPEVLKSNSKSNTKDKTLNPFSKESADTGFTRFGFKLATEPVKSVVKASPLPIAETSKRAEARKVIMREDKMSIVERKRIENRNYVRGVRTNRRFELQMQSRNMAA